MLIEIKAKVKRQIGNKTKNYSETYLTDVATFQEAANAIEALLARQQEEGTVLSYEVQSLKLSLIKEVYESYTGELPFIATLTDTYTDDAGNEKKMRYRVLLWADDLTQCNQRVHELARQGYDMQIEGIKQTDIEMIWSSSDHS